MIATIVLIIIAFFAGVLLAGKVASAWVGLKSDMAAIRTRAALDISAIQARLDSLETKVTHL